MNIYPDSLEVVTWTVTADATLDSATAVEAFLAGAWRPLTWMSGTTSNGLVYSRAAQATLAGTAVAPGSGYTVVTRADNGLPLVRVTFPGEVFVRPSNVYVNVK